MYWRSLLLNVLQKSRKLDIGIYKKIYDKYSNIYNEYVEYVRRRDTYMVKKGITRQSGIQIDIYGNPVHVLNVKEIYRMVKCGNCGESVKSSQAKLHLSFGTKLSICKKCLEEMENKKRARVSIRDSSRIGNTIESYVIGPMHA